MDFAGRLAGVREMIEQRLAALLPEAGNERDLVALAMRDSTLAPGKRVRPILLVLAAEGLGHTGEQAVELGCAVEMVHAASLVLDDMPCMDNAKLRRGRETVHVRFGEDVAILTAVALLSRAFGVVATIPGLRPEIRTQLVEILANTVGMKGLVRGQMQDLRDGSHERSAEEIALTNELKTGVLFGAVMDMAWLVSDAPDSIRPALQSFAIELGQAFQLYDDLQDHCTDTAKDRGKDDGKSTLVALYGREKVRERLYLHLSLADQHLRQAFKGEQCINGFVASIFAKAALLG
jgi:geranylgeranyl diphosphate synthase type II